MQDTLPKLLVRHCEVKGGSRLALRKKMRGIWQRYTWRECCQKVRSISLGLSQIGLEPGGCVSILANSDPEWFLSELAVQAAGGTVVGIDPASSGEETRKLLSLTGARFAFVQDRQQLAKVLDAGCLPSSLTRAILYRSQGPPDQGNAAVIGLEELIRLGDELDRKEPARFTECVGRGRGPDTAMLLVCRGAGGTSRVLPASHDFLISSTVKATGANPVTEDDDYVSVSAPGWLFEQVLGIGACLVAGQRLNFPEGPDTWPMDLREISPRVVLYPSAVWQMTVDAIQGAMKEGHWLKRGLYHRGLSIGARRANGAWQSSKGPRISVAGSLADIMAMRALRDKHGLNRVRIAYAAGSTLSAEVSSYLAAIGIRITQLYGSATDGVVSSPVPDEVGIQ